MLKNLCPGTRKAQVWLTFSVILLTVHIVAFGFSQAALYRFYESNTGNVSDNQTWVVSQLEVDYQKLKSNLSDAELEAAKRGSQTISPDKWADVMLAFDIYYSRVDTVANQITLLKAIGDVPKQYAHHLSLIKTNRNDLARVIDAVSEPDRQNIERTMALLAQVEVPVRELAVDTLFVLSQRADFERRTARDYMAFHVTVSFLTIALLITVSSTIFVMLRYSRTQYAKLKKVLSSQDQLIRQIPRAFVLADRNGTILRSNKGAEKLLGWDETEALGREISQMFPKKRRKYWKTGSGKYEQLNLKPGQSTTVREIAVDKYGSRFPVEILIMHLQDAGRSAYLLIIRSIALEQRAMRALRRDRTTAHKKAVRNSRLLSVMSHEMRTPLHGVVAALDLAKRQKLTSEGEKLIDVAMESSKAALSYADDAMQLVGIELNPQNAEKTKFSPRDIVCEVVEMLRPAALNQGNTILTEFGTDVHICIFGQAELLRHSISNLLSNAIKFTQNGTITVRLLLGAKAESLRVEVLDTGIGITVEQQDVIFSDYITQSEQMDSNWQGSGLGLGLFKRAVSVMRGQYGVESTPGKGSLFWFTFPIEITEPEENSVVDTIVSSDVSLPKTLRLLVVDDNALNLTLLGKMLDTLGINYDLANGGQEALAKASKVSFDMVLLDIGMPGLDGYSVAREIRKRDASKDAYIIAFTADSSIDKTGAMFQNSEMDELLLKPITLKALREKLIMLYTERMNSDPVTSPDEAAIPDGVLDNEITGQLLALGGIESLAPLMQSLMDQAHNIQRSLEQGTEDTRPDLSAQFHDLAGAAGMMGATRLASIARECEAVFDQDRKQIGDLIHRFRDAVESTEAEFTDLQQ